MGEAVEGGAVAMRRVVEAMAPGGVEVEPVLSAKDLHVID